MRTVVLTRDIQDHDYEGTFGTWASDSGFRCRTLELPWRDNKPNVSCIPKGEYICQWMDSPAHGWVYYVLDVGGGRTDVEIHAANLAGDIEAGYVAQLKGCIAPGADIAKFPAWKYPAGRQDQRGVTNSAATLIALQADLNMERNFKLIIQ